MTVFGRGSIKKGERVGCPKNAPQFFPFSRVRRRAETMHISSLFSPPPVEAVVVSQDALNWRGGGGTKWARLGRTTAIVFLATNIAQPRGRNKLRAGRPAPAARVFSTLEQFNFPFDSFSYG